MRGTGPSSSPTRSTGTAAIRRVLECAHPATYRHVSVVLPGGSVSWVGRNAVRPVWIDHRRIVGAADLIAVRYGGRMGLHVYDFGPADGHPLVVLHGLKGYGGRWREVAGRLPACRVYGPDLRGVGQSPPEPPWTLEQHATDILGVLDAVGLDRADIVGHSFGGAVAVALARFAPDRVRRLVLLDPSLAIPPDVALRHAGRELDVPSFADPAAAAAARAAQWPGSASHLVPDEVREHLAQDADGGAGATTWRWRWRPSPSWPARTSPHRRACPPCPRRASLGSVPPAQIAGWAAAPGVDLSVVEIHCGHMVYLELTHRDGRADQTVPRRID